MSVVWLMGSVAWPPELENLISGQVLAETAPPGGRKASVDRDGKDSELCWSPLAFP